MAAVANTQGEGIGSFEKRLELLAASGIEEHDRSQLALITSLIIDPLGFLPAFARATFRAAWVHSQDIHDENVLTECIQDAGGEAAEVLRRVNATKQEYAEALRARTTEAMRRNIFGVPMFVYGNKMLFGTDRFPMLSAWLTRTVIA